MTRTARPSPGAVAVALGALAACLAAAGCRPQAYTRLWADTALAGGRFSVQRDQWAYDGEPVTFELETDAGPAHFALFGCDGQETVVTTADVAGRYRWTRSFGAGPQPQVYEVYAAPFLMRGKCDWIEDREGGAWKYYPGGAEQRDIPTGPERVVRVTCYRVEIRIIFVPRGGPPRRLELALVTSTGGRTAVPRADAAKPGARGFLVLGPGPDGACEVVYTPVHAEVSRAGTTRAELLVEHADGSVQRLAQDVETP